MGERPECFAIGWQAAVVSLEHSTMASWTYLLVLIQQICPGSLQGFQRQCVRTSKMVDTLSVTWPFVTKAHHKGRSTQQKGDMDTISQTKENTATFRDHWCSVTILGSMTWWRNPETWKRAPGPVFRWILLGSPMYVASHDALRTGKAGQGSYAQSE